MKKLFFIMVLTLFASSICFAQQPPVAQKQVVKPQVQTKTVVGKIVEVVAVEPVNKAKARLVVVDENGNKVDFMVASTAKIQDTEKAAISLDKLVKDQKVEVICHEITEGENEAISVTQLK